MGTVTLRSTAGPFEFTRRTMVKHESGNEYLAPVTFRWCLDNSFKSVVPQSVWAELCDEFVDRKNNTRYKDILKEL